MKAFGQDTPLGRARQPVELASLYVALAEEDASFSTVTVMGRLGGGRGCRSKPWIARSECFNNPYFGFLRFFNYRNCRGCSARGWQ